MEGCRLALTVLLPRFLFLSGQAAPPPMSNQYEWTMPFPGHRRGVTKMQEVDR